MAKQMCKICGQDVDMCECLECPICKDHGNPECYKNMEHARAIAKALGHNLAMSGLQIGMDIAEESPFFFQKFEEDDWTTLLDLFHEGFRQACGDVYNGKVSFDERWDAGERKDCERIQEVLKRFGVEKSIEECRSLWSEYSDDMCATWLIVSDSDEQLIRELSRLGHIPEGHIPEGCPNCDGTGRSSCPLCDGTNNPFPDED